MSPASNRNKVLDIKVKAIMRRIDKNIIYVIKVKNIYKSKKYNLEFCVIVVRLIVVELLNVILENKLLPDITYMPLLAHRTQ